MLLFVRPYAPRLRSQVVELLRAAGVAPQDTLAIPKGTPDREAIKQVRQVRASLLVVPFHAHRDEDGVRVNGLALAERLLEEVPRCLHTPMLVPVSAAGLPAALLALTAAGPRAATPAVREHVLLIEEDAMPTSRMVGAVRAYVLGRTWLVNDVWC
ncbi:MAG: hypothetical protein AB7S68_36045 [Polyangiaceae bacterium]